MHALAISIWAVGYTNSDFRDESQLSPRHLPPPTGIDTASKGVIRPFQQQHFMLNKIYKT